MKIRSMKAVYICPICESKREVHTFSDDLNTSSLHTDCKHCIKCAVRKVASILDILNIECDVGR